MDRGSPFVFAQADILRRSRVDQRKPPLRAAHPVDSRPLEIARQAVVAIAERCGVSLKQNCTQEGKALHAVRKS